MLEKQDRFSDVSASAWYSEYVAWALEKGITSGTSETTFSPNANISRQDMALMIVRYLGLIGEELPVIKEKNLFADNTQIADYAKEAVEVMQRADRNCKNDC